MTLPDKTVEARILAYAQKIGWTYVPRGEAEKRRGFDQHTLGLLVQVAQDWLDEFERVQWLLRLSPRLRAMHGD
ncbi:MAG: hypothetical protein L0215_13145 [Gemmataceae bacterium]|nr:hypothetical protein [Gemmataceae bacterium]